MALRPDDWTRVRELFERALALPGSERAAYLANACGADQALRDEVARMLDSHDGAAGFLSTPAAVTFDPVATPSLEGQRIGPYQLGANPHPITHTSHTTYNYPSSNNTNQSIQSSI